MKTLETDRLLLRKFKEDDFAAVHSYAGCAENIVYMEWGPNSEEETRAFIDKAIEQANENPCMNYHYAAVLKDSGKLIGGCNFKISGTCGEIGWILHRDYWRQGYATEMGKAMLKFGFDELKIRRILAFCDAENIGSYRVMEKIGMRRESLRIESCPPNKLSNKEYGDEMSYALLRREWESKKTT